MGKSFENAQANAVGVLDERYNEKIVHFRGIKYATIPKRFASPQIVERNKSRAIQGLRYGPRCPHPPTDVREIMQIPRNLALYEPDREDELECCNLNITSPTNVKSGSLPVLIWIYGGAQVISFSTASHRLSDPGPLVAQSVEKNKPMLLVTFNFRLNVFAYGDGKGQKNLALQDQRMAIEWVKANIHDFGGDPKNITLAGESAGGIHIHALIATGTKVNRIILASGNLYTSDPKPPKVGQMVLDAVLHRSKKIESKKKNPSRADLDLSTIPAQTIVQALTELGVTTMHLQEDPTIHGWEENDAEIFKDLDGVMIGDCEFEAVLWLFGARVFPEAAVKSQFETNPPEPGMDISKKYLENTDISDPKLGMIKSGGLDFVTDAHFAYPAYLISESLRASRQSTQKGPKVYQYIFDEVNPWGRKGSSTNRAGHAVDLLAVFGNYDTDFPPSSHMAEVGKALRGNWITFVNGPLATASSNNSDVHNASGEPWDPRKVFAYGPNGVCGELSAEDYSKRRRTGHFAVLKEAGREFYDAIWTKLAGAADVVLAGAKNTKPKQKDVGNVAKAGSKL